MNKRIFIAFPVPREIRDYLGLIAREIASGTAPDEIVRWVDPEGMHMTAQFLGDLDEEQIRLASEICRETAREYRPTVVKLGRPSWFPEDGSPRVVTVSVNEDASLVLRQIQATLGRKLEQRGIDVDHRLWSPHVTLGRVKTRLEAGKVRADVDPMEFTVDEIHLLESQRTSDGATYSPIEIFKLVKAL